MSSNQTSEQIQTSRQMGEGEDAVRGAMKQYYGQEVKSKDDCQTSVNCVRVSAVPPHLRHALSLVHHDITDKYYGCGLVIPEAVEGCSVLDLGCGSGRDCFAVSQLVGPTGRVVGIDMTQEQLAVARKYVDYHTEKFGFPQPNVEFTLGQIEKLSEAGLKDNSFDIVISNCVICLCPDKSSVLKEAFRVLKEGGELYFSDMYTDSDLSPTLRQDRVLWGEGMGGALQWQELYRLAQQVGFSPPRLVKATKVDVSKFTHVLGGARFVAGTYRLFKLPSVTPAASVVTYKGGILGYPDCLTLDHATAFKKGEDLAVDGEVTAILSSSRFRQFFSFSQSGPVTPVTTHPKVDPFQKIGSASTLLIPTPRPQPQPGHPRHNCDTGNPQGAVNVKSSRGNPPEETLHCCGVTSVVFIGACSDLTYTGHHLLSPLLMTIIA